MNTYATFQKRQVELYYDDLQLIRKALYQYNFSFYEQEKPYKFSELDIHRWTALKSFYDKILVPRIAKGKPAKDIVKLQLTPNQLLSLFNALIALEIDSIDLTRIVGKLHHALINIPLFDHRTITADTKNGAAS